MPKPRKGERIDYVRLKFRHFGFPEVLRENDDGSKYVRLVIKQFVIRTTLSAKHWARIKKQVSALGDYFFYGEGSVVGVNNNEVELTTETLHAQSWLTKVKPGPTTEERAEKEKKQAEWKAGQKTTELVIQNGKKLAKTPIEKSASIAPVAITKKLNFQKLPEVYRASPLKPSQR